MTQKARSIIDAVLSDAGKNFINVHRGEPTDKLYLKYTGKTDLPYPLLINQLEAANKAKTKFDGYDFPPDFVFPPNLSLEQSSTPATARHKASLLSGESAVDLTGGMGMDAFHLAQKFSKVTVLEQDELLAGLLRHNAGVMNLTHIEVIHARAEDWTAANTVRFDALFADPARREGGKKRVLFTDCSPDITRLLPSFNRHFGQVLIKASPMMDGQLALNETYDDAELHAVSVNNECKELLIHKYAGCIKGKRTATELYELQGIKKEFSFTAEDEQKAGAPIGPPEKYLYDPSPAMNKLGAFKLPCRRMDLRKLHSGTHLFTGSQFNNEFPGRVFEITGTGRLRPEDAGLLCPEGKAILLTRNLAEKPEALFKKLKLKEGGNTYLFAYTGADGKPALVAGIRV